MCVCPCVCGVREKGGGGKRRRRRRRRRRGRRRGGGGGVREEKGRYERRDSHMITYDKHANKEGWLHRYDNIRCHALVDATLVRGQEFAKVLRVSTKIR